MSSKMSRCNLKLLALSMAGVAALGLAAPTASASVSGAIVGDLHDIPDCTPVVALVVPGALNSLAAIPESIPHGLQTRKVTAKLEQRGGGDADAFLQRNSMVHAVIRALSKRGLSRWFVVP